jgi:hypothetical protein
MKLAGLKGDEKSVVVEVPLGRNVTADELLTTTLSA